MLINRFNLNIQALKAGIKNTASRPIESFSAGNYLLKANTTADTFLAVNKGATEGLVKSSWFMQNASKGPLKYFGKLSNVLSDITIKAGNSIGNSIINSPSTSLIGKAASKLPLLSKIGNGLSRMSKLPGLATMLIAGEAVWGAGKAINKGIHGNGREASHQLIKTGVTLGAQLTGLALLAGGIIASPFTAGTSLTASLAGIATLVGTDMAGRVAGEKLANIICGSIKKPIDDVQKSDLLTPESILSNETIEDFIKNLYCQPILNTQDNPFIMFNSIK